MVKNFFEQLLQFLGLLIISLAIVLPIRYFIIQPFLVRGDSMSPTFHNFDYLFVERVSYYFRDPQRGEVIIFRFPKNEKDYFIKRIIGLPGERVTIKDGKVSIIRPGENKALDEEAFFEQNEKRSFHYLPKGFFTQGDIEVAMDENEYFVLGDNRSASFDSRSWGILPKRDIIGRVLVRIWPPQKAKAFFGPINEQSFSTRV